MGRSNSTDHRKYFRNGDLLQISLTSPKDPNIYRLKLDDHDDVSWILLTLMTRSTSFETYENLGIDLALANGK